MPLNWQLIVKILLFILNHMATMPADEDHTAAALLASEICGHLKGA